MIIAIDFDGTIVENRYPEIGSERPFAIETLKLLQQDHHRLVLWTCREGQLLEDALSWCRDRGVEFYAANRDYPEETTDNNPHFTRKLKADLFIDDRNLGGLPVRSSGITCWTKRPMVSPTMSITPVVITRRRSLHGGGHFKRILQQHQYETIIPIRAG